MRRYLHLLPLVLALALLASTTLVAAEKAQPPLKITVVPYIGAHAFPDGSGVGSSPEIGSMFTTPLTETTHLLLGMGFSQGFKGQKLYSVTTTEWGLQFDTSFKLISPYATSYATVLFVRDSFSKTTQLSLGFGLRFFMKKEGKMVLRTDTRFLSGSTYRAGFERLAVTKRPDWFKPYKKPEPKKKVKPAPKPTPKVVTNPEPKKPLYYRVIASTFKSQDDANELSKKLVKEGYKTYLWKDDSGAYNVQVYFVTHKKEADAYRDKLIKDGYTKTFVLKK